MNYEIYDDNGFIICQECGNSLKRITPLHLQKHGMTLQEYNEKYNFPPIVKLRDAGVIDEDNKKELIRDYENEEIEEKKYGNLPKQKQQVIELLKDYLSQIEPNYIVELYGDPGRHFLEHVFVTDISDPKRKIAFFFPDVFWRNEENVKHPDKYNILEQYGWRVFVVNGSNVVDGTRRILDNVSK